MEIIVPAAGMSSRFKDMKPKYLLYDYKGDLMLKNAVTPFIGKYNITIGILKEHDDQYDAQAHLRAAVPGIRIVVLDEKTSGPAETVYEILRKSNITAGPILIKDCDSFFDHDVVPGNYVCVSNIKDHDVLKKLNSKSFVRSNENDVILDIIEKEVVSDTFCVGAYKFTNARDFLGGFVDLRSRGGEIYVSHVIQYLIESRMIFYTNPVLNYVDVGTAEDWFEYNDKPVIFCDIDGTLIKAQARTAYGEPPEVLTANVEVIKEYARKGSQIVFVTARPHSVAKETEQIIRDLGFEDFVLLIGLNNTRRILVNDYNSHSPFPRAEAVNIERDTETLGRFL